MTKIYYFSGTGNTLWSAKKIAESIGETGESVTMHTIGAEIQKGKTFIEADAAVLLFPAYAFGAPAGVRRFAQNAVFKTPYTAAFVSFGTIPGGALAEIGRILKRKKTPVSYFGRIPAVENYTAIFGPQKPETIARRLALQKEATARAARLIIAREKNRIFTFRPFSSFVSFLFSLGLKVFYRHYRVSADCNGCGICEKICPVAAIAMREKRPVFSNRCEHCQRCLNWCQKRAIHFGRLNAAAPRYHHPDIDIGDMR